MSDYTAVMEKPANNANGTGEPSGSIHLSDLKQSAVDAAASAKTQTAQALGQAKESAGQALTQARDEIKNRLGQSKDRAADGLNGLTQSVHAVSDTLRQNNLTPVAEVTDTLAGQVDRISGYLKNSDVDTLTRDAEAFARENPAIVIGGALLIGIAIGRFLRSSGRSAAAAGATPASAPAPYAGATDSSEALVVAGDMDAFGNTGGRQDIDGDDSIEGGEKPLHAGGYVIGGVLGGAPA